jgi:type IV fimbrial biogenesis protein FimT
MNYALPAQEGFTLTELMIALAVAGILATLAVPSFLEAVRTSRMTAQTDELIAALNLGSSEARKRGGRVSLCKSANGTACATSGGWEQGWILFADTDSSGDRQNTETILRSQQALPANYTLRASTALADAIGFLPNGGTTGSGLFVTCYRNAISGSRAIQVNSESAVRQLADTNSNKVPNLNATTELTDANCSSPP